MCGGSKIGRILGAASGFAVGGPVGAAIGFGAGKKLIDDPNKAAKTAKRSALAASQAEYDRIQQEKETKKRQRKATATKLTSLTTTQSGGLSE